MSLLDQIQRWVEEPPPEYIFELSERGLASVQTRNPATLQISHLGETALIASPSHPNLTRFDLFQGALPKPANGKGVTRRMKAALVIPDYAARISVLDFEELPADPAQRQALIRFRLRKSVPFAIEDAQVACEVQVNDPPRKKIEVVACVISRPVLEEYEALLRSSGFHPGVVVPSCLAALPLCPVEPNVLTLLAKLSGSVLSILLVENGSVRVVRCVDLTTEESGPEEEPALINTLLQQTLAFTEDEFGQAVQRLVLCGFGDSTVAVGETFERELGLQWAPLRSQMGEARQENSGLLGIMEQYAV